jgi:hypothetical protein
MNTQKMVVGGIAAGVVLFVLDFLSNTLILGDRMTAAMDALNPALSANMESTSALVTFAIIDLVFGLALVWLYATIRPKFGPGPKTAAIAGVYFWLVTGMVWASLVVMGLFSWGLWFMGGATWLVTALAAAMVGGKLYNE